jgi:diguanylate cyclase (GGDEF)-like protein
MNNLQSKIKNSTIINSQSLLFKINTILVPSVLVFSLTFGFFYYQKEKEKVLSRLNLESHEIMERISQNIGEALERENPDRARNFLFAEMSYQNILAFAIKSGSYEIRFTKGLDGKIVENPSLVDFQNKKNTASLVLKKPLLNKSGSIEAYFTDRFLLKEKASLIINMILQILIIYLLLSIVLYWGVKIIILNPVGRLNELVKGFTNYDFKIRSPILSLDEIGILSENLNLMAACLETYHEKLIHQNFIDPITELPNRQQILLDIEKTREPVLILMNLDFFKEINDCYGHKAGDWVLKEITRRLKKIEAAYRFRLYRMPSDEFALLFDQQMEIKELEKIIKNAASEIHESEFLLDNNNEIHVQATFGAVRSKDIYPDKIKNGIWRYMAAHADMALKRAKKNRKSFIIYQEYMEIPREYENNIIWKQKLKDALKNKRIVPYFQPIVNNYTGIIEKYECLARLIDQHGQAISPSFFLDIAKKNHLYHEITHTVMDHAFRVFRDTDFEFSINLTLYDILDEEMNLSIIEKIKNNRDVANRLVFEILESEGIENYKEVMIFIEEVKELGCKIAIDDFGSGYSNFDHILRLEVNYIKIDSSLIKNLDKDKNAQTIIKTIANFARELGLKTISEHVHSKEVHETSVGLGVDYSQGYYFGEPQECLLLN